VLRKGIDGLSDEFTAKIRQIRPAVSQMSAFLSTRNRPKNRYNDVPLLDGTRIKLRLGANGSDYIHASKVRINSSKFIICAQGPLENTIADFWSMILEQKCKAVVQLCQEVEDGRPKCETYIPREDEGDTMRRGNVRLEVLERDIYSGYTAIEQTRLQVSRGDERHRLMHLRYYRWPDHGVPHNICSYSGLHDMIATIFQSGCIAVHCSAGIGRTGVFTMIEKARDRLLLRANRDFSMSNSLAKVRAERALAVQNAEQYLFIHRVLLETMLNNGLIQRTRELMELTDLMR